MFCKMILAFIFGFYNEADKFGKEAQSAKHPMHEKSYLSLPLKFVRAMISYRLYESAIIPCSISEVSNTTWRRFACLILAIFTIIQKFLTDKTILFQ